MLECVRAYNDFLAEWCSADPERLIPVMASPFWDVDAWVREIGRCALLGHKAVLACAQPQAWGEPLLADRHWDPVWSAAQEAELSISFHIGSGDLGDLRQDPAQIGRRANFAKLSALCFLDNSRCLAELIFGDRRLPLRDRRGARGRRGPRRRGPPEARPPARRRGQPVRRGGGLLQRQHGAGADHPLLTRVGSRGAEYTP